ncbi:inverse autotransporter beta domain-containing protein [Xenorhabdus lircayensis]|uniref:Inverse autotransporter beta domain-containing protein n=1 Tax=Xenorhabdus lircayensis TaxID=2763499 RepID=A0ABS0UA39_9GAMM|nr:inverse autotransporter beta domain-containing protein [Xenorhabdus lircayensis]MBI6550723.1 inverse autotransporter beta domain-containing protein [Xenorhabdus lircayensis]
MLKKQDRQWTNKQHHLLKRVAWVTLFAQVAFPVAGTFTPAGAAAKAPPLAPEKRLPHLQTRPYRLTAGDSVKTVAKRHGLTVTELKKLNQLRTFSKPFTALGAGDEIEVPQSPSDTLLADSLRQAATPETPANTAESTLASVASRAAGMLKSGNIVDSTKNQLRGMAVSGANQMVQNWLQRYGTVKLQASVDERGRLDGSQFDMLLPLYDTEKQMAFTQFGLRHIDSRTTANFGLGQRHFLGAGLFGYNAFLDHDMTRDHTRFGLGAEYARDFMKFGANGYFRASGWKDGKKLNDYEERPANGFDLRAEGYVPAYPQLGGKLIYEQYFGDEVGLLSEARRQKNPAAFTVGASYTPVPLVTLGLDRRQSASGGGETRFNLGLNYEIGTPWSRQADPDAVAFKRNLQGGRYDLVERNNQIVLEYRKKNLIRLMMESRISGRGNAVIPLNVSVSTQHGLKEIVWDTANLVAGGGRLESVSAPVQAATLAAEPVRGGTRYLLTLPPYHDRGNNTYTLSGIAYDHQGNASDRMDAQIQVVSSAVSPAGSGFEPAEKSMVADGKTQTVIRLKLTDKDGRPVTGAAGDITLTDDKTQLTGDGKEPALGTDVKEVPEGSGIYEVPATAGTRHGKWKITPTVDGHALTPTVIDFGDSLANMIDPDRTEFKPDNGPLNQEGDSTDIVLNLKDKDGNPITGAADKITLTDDKSELYGQTPNPTLGAVREDPPGSGIYKAKVTAGKKKGTWKITPTVDGKALKPTNITFGQSLTDIVDTKGPAFTPATNVLAANNEDSTLMTLHLKDKSGKPIPNAQDSITFDDNGDQLTGDGKNKPTIDKVWEAPENSGIYRVKVKAGDKTGPWKITTRIDGKPLETPTEITFGTSTADLIDPDNSAFIPEKGALPNEGDTTVITLNLKDINGQPVTGAENSINLIPDNHELYGQGETLPTYGKAKEVPPGSGTYEVPVTAGAKKGQWTLTPDVFGKRLKRPATMTFGQSLADILDTQGATVEPVDGSHALAADGVSTKTLHVVLKDKQGQPVTGAKDSLRVSGSGPLQGNGKDPQTGKVKEVADGVYEVIVTAGQKTGHWTLTTTVDGTAMKKETVIEFDENKAPSVSGLQLEGGLHVNGVLHALYQFDAKDGNTTDRSFYAWGEKGTTAKQVMALAEAAGVKEPVEWVQKNGEGRVAAGATGQDRVKYTVENSDIGKVLEVSVLAANEANLRAKAPQTTDVTDPQANKGITGGNGQGGVADPKAKPGIEQIVLSGELEINQPLTARYTFNANGGDATDLSQFAWHEKDTPVTKYEPVPDKTGTLTTNLKPEDAGKTIAITVKPINGDHEAGDPKTVDTGMTDTGINKTTSKGAKPGTILDPAARPAIDNLMLTGNLYVNEILTAHYAFSPNNGDTTDNSTYVWTRFQPEDKPSGTREKIPDPESTGAVDGKKVQSGAIPSYTLGENDVGKLIEITITPKNSRQNGIGKPISVNTGLDNSALVGGDSKGGIINPTNGPVIDNLAIHGTLEMGQPLTGSYFFNPNGGGDQDDSIFAWGIKYPTSTDPNAPKSPEELVSDLGKDPNHVIKPDMSGTVPEYILKPEDSGQIIQLAMVPRNTLSMRGEQIATDTEQETKKGSVTGGNLDGTVKGIADDFTVDVDKDKAKAKIDLVEKKSEPIELTIKTQKDNKSIGGVPVTINLSAVSRYLKSTEAPTVELEVQKGVLAQKQGNTYTGHTDEKGDLVIKIIDPNGKGVKTTLKVAAEGANGSLPTKDKDVIFTVITSPDVAVANYWGHMHEFIEFKGIKYYRTPLHNEYPGTNDENGTIDNEDWAYYNTIVVEKACTRNGKILPDSTELVELGRHYAINQVNTKYGWPTSWQYYSSSLDFISLKDGDNRGPANKLTNRFAACRDAN